MTNVFRTKYYKIGCRYVWLEHYVVNLTFFEILGAFILKLGRGKMKTQTFDDMINVGATKDEARIAIAVFSVLKPCLKIKSDGKIRTLWGEKTPLGMYRVINRVKEEVMKGGDVNGI